MRNGKADCNRLTKAQETIYECYGELQELGILTVVPADAEEKVATVKEEGRKRNGKSDF